MYPEMMIIPMREELSRAGIKEARTAEAVDEALAKPGTTLLVVNSICGCAAGKMRPGVRLALHLAGCGHSPRRQAGVPDAAFRHRDRDRAHDRAGAGPGYERAVQQDHSVG
jgi:putative YphP/YqiW family bacilliredoxin